MLVSMALLHLFIQGCLRALWCIGHELITYPYHLFAIYICLFRFLYEFLTPFQRYGLPVDRNGGGAAVRVDRDALRRRRNGSLTRLTAGISRGFEFVGVCLIIGFGITDCNGFRRANLCIDLWRIDFQVDFWSVNFWRLNCRRVDLDNLTEGDANGVQTAQYTAKDNCCSRS